MAKRSVPLSVRLTIDEAEFIAGLDMDGAHTPSEKIREVIAVLRDQQERPRDYYGQLKFAESLFAPVARNLRAGEHQQGVHSELISRLCEWLPELVAFVLTQEEKSDDLSVATLAEFEMGVLRRLTVMMQSIMHLALMDRAPCYDPSIVKDQIQPVLDLADVVTAKVLANSNLRRSENE